MPKGDIDKLKRHILGIRGLISNPELRGLSEKTGELGETFLNLHNLEGNYLGGRYANKGYSTVTLPVFFFGEYRYIERSKNIRVNAARFNLSNVLIKSEDIFWRTDSEGQRVAYIKGGYAKWLQYTRPSKDLNKVDHTFTGLMLNALTHEIIIQTNKSEIRWFVRSPQDDKAYYTNKMREWMGFFQEEIDDIKQLAIDQYSVAVFERLTE